MAKVTLNPAKPGKSAKASRTYNGVVFRNGVETTVKDEIAAKLEKESYADEFTIVRTAEEKKETAPVVTEKRPENQNERTEAILSVLGQLSKDAGDFDGDGKPKLDELSKVLGWDVTAEDRDAALAQKEKSDATASRAATGKPTKGAKPAASGGSAVSV